MFDAGELRRKRQAAGISMLTLARRAGVGPTTVYMLESGKLTSPRLGTVEKLAKALGLAATVFFAQQNRETDESPAA